MMRTLPVHLLIVAMLGIAWGSPGCQPTKTEPTSAPAEGDLADARATSEPPASTTASTGDFLGLLNTDRATFFKSLTNIETQWHPGNRVMLIETITLAGKGARNEDIIRVLEQKTGKQFGFDLDQWFRSIWNEDYQPHPEYAEFKSALYSQLDPRFAEYFRRDFPAAIRLDEIRWGGVRRDGIPPLENPPMISAAQARYLDDSDVVFGVFLGGEAKAYPKRILAWHEMVKDTVGGISIGGVYCTLCGSMIVYDTHLDGRHFELGTSGFLYRSNKLMYDHETQSLWSTLTGRPVVGPLVGQDIELARHYVVTTSWGQWRRRHPDTQVPSLDTGYRRDYREGAAYRDYFATDRLMFTVPKLDQRLKNKDEILALRWNEPTAVELAISTRFLSKRPIYHGDVEEHPFVVLTDSAGASRVFESSGVRFTSFDGHSKVTSADGSIWTLSEEQLTSSGSRSLRRLPHHRAFWFGWVSAFPDTLLVK